MSIESMPEFVPPTPGGSSESFNQPSQTPNVASSSFERDRIVRSFARGKKIKTATTAVIQTRAQFVDYLRSNDMDLWTSAVEFQNSGDFIMSSYVVYPSHNNLKEPLGAFLQRYPHLAQPVMAIRDALRPMQQNMQVKTKKFYE